MLAMIARMKANRALLKSQKSKFKSNRSLYSSSLDEKLEFKKVSEEELTIIKQKNIQKIRREELKRFLKFIGVILLIAIISLLLFR